LSASAVDTPPQQQRRIAGSSSSSGGGGAADGASTSKANGSLFVDAVTGRHASPGGPAPLLARRRLAWSAAHGWAYDVWIDDPAAHALAGANSRFSLPAIAGRVADLLGGVAAPAAAGAARAAAALAGGLRQLGGPGDTGGSSRRPHV
jgi:hypothetical protein